MTIGEEKSEVSKQSTQTKIGVDTQNVDKKTRINIRIPKQSRIYEFLYGDTPGKNNSNKTKWRQLDELLEIAEQAKEEWAERIFDEFVSRMCLFYPAKEKDLKQLRQLILWQILEGEELSDAYYDKTLRNLGK